MFCLTLHREYFQSVNKCCSQPLYMLRAKSWNV